MCGGWLLFSLIFYDLSPCLNYYIHFIFLCALWNLVSVALAKKIQRARTENCCGCVVAGCQFLQSFMTWIIIVFLWKFCFSCAREKNFKERESKNAVDVWWLAAIFFNLLWPFPLPELYSFHLLVCFVKILFQLRSWKNFKERESKNVVDVWWLAAIFSNLLWPFSLPEL